MLDASTVERTGETYALNLRFLLIVCVFIGNLIEPLILQAPHMHALYVWIFTFHMPLFVFVTGYFAKHNLRGDAGRKLLIQIGLQYLIFQSIYSVLDITVFKVNQIHHSFFAPYLLLWFLASHIFWRLALRLMLKWPVKLQFLCSLAGGILVGYLQMDGTWLSLSRSFIYLPFFVAGYHYSYAYFVKFITRNIRRLALLTSLILLGAAAIWSNQMQIGWLYGSMTYAQLQYHEWYAGLFRATIYMVQIISAAAILLLVPQRQHRITDWGKRTLYVFLLHGLIVRFAAVSPIYSYIESPAASFALMLAAILLTILLCHPKVKQMTSWIIEPRVEWLFAAHSQPTKITAASSER
ncbi:fucose 4-O-acetylase [Paenibacillus sp. CAA11]|uniref:acyltransferase family protein n=1 Tax=Paenibacillus sp. CAA11 TaxID=1532905 RepID=UPI000D3DC7A3|nr:fucose 4-O-acetylase [Paenibacillus sp. CAA11]AWB45658.1 fucose 4-O-acetylase [Paenibacillus sp. CAA11]